ncbi:endo-1,5-alpha-L-arabinosidase [Corynespora cassiicola Philippines]|uniref:Arabinan endo-1,5-alpha-L-arabinosidase n=1 Tax=Corynespora cassiicola Philippines TaxID=1448308 RepID=A0A2T2NKJ1_CORCC|nr:endo-1,5-alpha-L-arabinosidase [Corynespora cassiicola Philippines]
MRNSNILSSLAFLCSAGYAAAAWPEPEPCTGNCTYIHDPALARRPDGTWLRFSTLGNIAIATAPSLTGPWEYEGAMLPEGTKIDTGIVGQELWAPDVFYVAEENKFYAYYSVSKSGSQSSDIGVATSESGMPGTWEDHGSVGVPKSGRYNLIDANFFRECDTCTNHWFFGSAWDGVFHTTLNDDHLTWSGVEPTQMLYNSTFPPNQDYPAIVEGGFLFWWPIDGKNVYFMFFSSGACCNNKDDLENPGDEYKILVCKGDSPTGPWKDKDGKDCRTENGGTLLLGSHGENVYAPGGQGVGVDPDTNRIFIYYHYANPKIGYEYAKFLFGFNYLDVSSGWPEITV